MKTHTLRGIADEGIMTRLVVDNGNPTHAFKIVKFVVGPIDPTVAAGDVSALLAVKSNAPSTWRWDDNRQVAWASSNVHAAEGLTAPYSVIDPDRLIVRDLFISGVDGGTIGFYNYLIVLEAVDITENEAVLQLIKERSQDDLK